MADDPRKYLSDMIDRAEFALEFLQSKSIDDLQNDRVTRSAVERELMVLGEALFQLHCAQPEFAERITNWEKIIGFRHVLVHGYDSLNMQIIWDVVHDDLPGLIVQLKGLLDEFQDRE